MCCIKNLEKSVIHETRVHGYREKGETVEQSVLSLVIHYMVQSGKKGREKQYFSFNFLSFRRAIEEKTVYSFFVARCPLNRRTHILCACCVEQCVHVHMT